ncbi:MAG: hypothetical protein M1839_008967 [Geoglossum umbratile]|nr:MAG: hypothetical protein M1839_008967 [Geoglossum umbratile]
MSDTNRITFETPIEKTVSRTPSDIVSKEKYPHTDDVEASPIVPIKDRGGSATAHASIHNLDLKKKQQFSGLTFAWLVYQSIGVIYGDIGTSPLYVYSSTFKSTPSHEDLVGALSLIIWSLTLIVTIKYCLIVLLADDEGEGGTFALYTLLTRFSNIGDRDPRSTRSLKLERYLTGDLSPPNRSFRNVLEKNRKAQWLLKILAILGVCLIMADGILTPAQSVLGLIVPKPNITISQTIGISCALLIVLFLAQPLGTSKLGSTFAPIVIIWLVFNMAFGIYNLLHHDHTVLKAFSPVLSIQYLSRNKESGWKSLCGILLAITGVETLYADLGAFSLSSIRVSWIFFGYPCLLLAYIGQAAYISTDPTGKAWSNPFFNTVPPGMFWPGMIMAILAAIVASQATITATFQLISQVMNMSYFPNVKLVHTSKKFHGQVYIPPANWLMMIGTVIVTAFYNNTTKLGQAYGTCVMLVTFITTCMVTIAAIIVWRLHLLIVLAGFLVFASLDGLFLSSALTKFPQGAWFTLLLGGVLSVILFIWRHGKETQWMAERSDRIPISQLVTSGDDGKLYLKGEVGDGRKLPKMKGVGIFFDKEGDLSPAVYTHFIRKFHAGHEVTVFFHLRPIPQPTAPIDDQYTISRASIANGYQIIVRHGYNEHIVTKDLAGLIHNKLRHFVTTNPLRLPLQDNATGPNLSPSSSTSSSNNHPPSEPSILDSAFRSQVVYIVGKEQLKITPLPLGASSLTVGGLLRRLSLNSFIWIRELTRSKVQEMNVPVELLVEVGFVKEM